MLHKIASISFLQCEFLELEKSHLIVVRAVGRFLHRCVLLVIANLHAHHGVHVEAYQLPRLDHCDADLVEGVYTSLYI